MKKLFQLSIIVLITFSNLYSQNKNDYIKEIPFDFTYGIPVIEVQINGDNYNFLFDTGMPTTISKKLNEKLKLNKTRNKIGIDVNGNKNNENYGVLKNLKVLGIDFNNTEVLIANLESSFELKCVDLDGVFGNNLIKNAIWKINYDTKKIYITNNIEKFNITDNMTKISFNTKKGYTPKINIKINGKKRKNIMFDTGSNGGVNIPIEEYSSKKFTKSVEYFGSSKTALYGRAKINKSIISRVDNIKIGKIIMENQFVFFNKTTPLIGNEFLSNFDVIIDYNKNTIYLEKKRENKNTQLNNFGFSTNIIENKMIITMIFQKSVAFKKLEIGDEIIEINGVSVSKILQENTACSHIKKIFSENENNVFKIKHRKEILNLNLTKNNILE